MIESEATVTAVEGEYAWVRGAGSGCGRCSETGGCGSDVMGRLFCSTPRQFRVRNDVRARVGDKVRIAVAEGAVLGGAWRAYGRPLLLMLGAAAVASALAPDPGRDAWAAAGAAFGLLAGWLLLRRGNAGPEPFIVGPNTINTRGTE